MTAGEQICHIWGIKDGVGYPTPGLQVNPARGGVQNGSRGWSGSSTSSNTPPLDIKSLPVSSGRKTGSDGTPWGCGVCVNHTDTLVPYRDGYGGASEGTLRLTLIYTMDTKTSTSANPDTLDPPLSYGKCTPLPTCRQGSGTIGKLCSPSCIRSFSDLNSKRVTQGSQIPFVANPPVLT